MTSISNSDDYIDPRDVESAVDDMSSDIDDAREEAAKAIAPRLANELACYGDVDADEIEAAAESEAKSLSLADLVTLGGLDEETAESFPILSRLWREIEVNSGDARHETLISESAFRDYCHELLFDCHSIPQAIAPYIDLDKWVDDCRHDYSEIDFDGSTYLVRA